MTAFLRWFPAFRRLEQQLYETSIAREGLQGEVRALRGEVEKLREDLQAAHESERKAYQKALRFEYRSPSPIKGEPILDTGYVNMRRVVESQRAEERAKLAKEILGVQ